jgi:hypothetical protein
MVTWELAYIYIFVIYKYNIYNFVYFIKARHHRVTPALKPPGMAAIGRTVRAGFF